MEATSMWSRLRWPFKAILIAAPVITFGYFAINDGWFMNNGPVDHSITRSEPKSSFPAGNNDKGKNSVNLPVKEDSRIFAYQPEKPVNGTIKGIVEVGATGFNSFIINVDKEKRWEIISKDFGQSLVYEGLATTDDIRSGLKKYISSMFDKGVKSKNVHFIISSGAQKVPKTAVISSELKKMGFVVNLVSPEQEGKLALKSVLPAFYQGNSFVTDIGSGNTKISWMNGKSIAAVETEGSKYYELEKSDEAVFSDVKSKVSAIPDNKREVCFIIGGVPYELAKQHRQAEERYTVLKSPSAYQADKPKLKSGLNIYKAIQEGTGCDTFVFDWDANFSIGFLLAMPD